MLLKLIVIAFTSCTVDEEEVKTNRGLGCWNLYQRKDLHYPLVDKYGKNTFVAVALNGNTTAVI